MRLAILGGGQLARMLGLAGYPLGLEFRCLDPSAQPCAAEIMEHVQGSWDDPQAIGRLLQGADCVTFETENIPLSTLDLIAASGIPCYPSAEALRLTQDRLLEKDFLRSCGFETAPYRAPASREELADIAVELGYPLILKTRRMGYDGKGQRIVRRAEDLQPAWDELGGQDLIAEGWVAFTAEGSLLAVRGMSGPISFYPVCRNVHVQGVLFSSEPWQGFSAMQVQLQSHMQKLMETLNYRGVLALEFFLHDGHILANELAPRVHNSGHWTQHASVTSQFENHLRAIAGLPLGSTASFSDFRMLNVLGRMPPLPQLLTWPHAKLCDYRKAAAPGRKMGHVTLLNLAGSNFEAEWQALLQLVTSG